MEGAEGVPSEHSDTLAFYTAAIAQRVSKMSGSSDVRPTRGSFDGAPKLLRMPQWPAAVHDTCSQRES